MSWITRLQQDIIIETGDGKTYRPQWMNASYLQDFNVGVFNFVGVEGTLVRRRAPIGRQFALEIHFIGEDNLDIAEEFRLSAYDQRHWHIKHPLYDEIRVQPRSLKFDNTKYNISKITGVVLETIAGVFPRGSVSTTDQIRSDKATLDEVSANGYANQTSNIQATEVTQIQNDIDILESSTSDIIETEEEQVSFRNAVIEAQQAVVNLINEPLAALREVQNVINFPGQIQGNIEARVTNFTDQFNRVLTSLGNIFNASRNNKVYFETFGATHISAACIASITNAEYETREDVDSIVGQILDLYNSYLDAINDAQTESQTEVDSYNPNPDVVRGVQDVVFLTLANLFEISLESQQEHIIINEADSNVILLTHRVYGLDDLDENIVRFKRTNKIGLKEILVIPKDREIIYYI